MFFGDTELEKNGVKSKTVWKQAVVTDDTVWLWKVSSSVLSNQMVWACACKCACMHPNMAQTPQTLKTR